MGSVSELTFLPLNRLEAKKITDRVVNLMEGVQNLRKAVYESALHFFYGYQELTYQF